MVPADKDKIEKRKRCYIPSDLNDPDTVADFAFIRKNQDSNLYQSNEEKKCENACSQKVNDLKQTDWLDQLFDSYCKIWSVDSYCLQKILEPHSCYCDLAQHNGRHLVALRKMQEGE